MSTLTEQLNQMVSDYIRLKETGSDKDLLAAVALADFCAGIVQRPHVARTDDGAHEFRVELQSSADQFREAWRKDCSVSQFKLKLAIMVDEPKWFPAHKGGVNRP